MRLTVSITLSDQDAHNPDNSFECRVIDTYTQESVGGFVWTGSEDSPLVNIFSEAGDFVSELIKVDIEITSENAFDHTLDVEVN